MAYVRGRNLDGTHRVDFVPDPEPQETERVRTPAEIKKQAFQARLDRMPLLKALLGIREPVFNSTMFDLSS